MAKINYKTIMLIAQSTNFSDFHRKGGNGGDFEDNEDFDVGDEGKAESEMLSNVHADAVLLDLLFKFNDRQKIILMYQLLRESGFNLNHGDCAKTLSLTREHYMFLLKGVKKKAAKVLQGIEE